VSAVLAALWPVPGSQNGGALSQQLASAVGPYRHHGLLGTAMHVGLRCLGSRRRLLGSLGARSFAGGSIGTLTALTLSWSANARETNPLAAGPDDPVAFWFLLAAVTSYLVCATMATTLLGLNRVAIWKVAAAGGFRVAVTAFLFGSLLPPGVRGWRRYIRVDLGEREFSFGFQG
jgi:hypothetical protein